MVHRPDIERAPALIVIAGPRFWPPERCASPREAGRNIGETAFCERLERLCVRM